MSTPKTILAACRRVALGSKAVTFEQFCLAFPPHGTSESRYHSFRSNPAQFLALQTDRQAAAILKILPDPAS